MKLNKIWRTNTKGLSQKAMSTIGPKVLIKFEVKEREEETFISRADFYDFKYNSFAGDLLPFNNKDKESTFEQYVKKVMNYDKLFESIEGLAKMIHEDTRLADHLKVDVIEILVTILGKSDNVYIQRSAAYILSRAKLDSCDTIIRGKAIAVLVDLLASKSFIIAVPAVVTLTRFACHFPEYLHVIIEKGALEAVHKVSQMVKDTTMMKNLAKFMAVVCRAKICPEKECLCLDIIERMIDAGFLHIERACYALQYLSYKRCIRIQDETIYKLTQLSCERDNAVAASALGVLGNIARWGNSHQIQSLAEYHDTLLCLRTSLSGSLPMKLQWEVCTIISKIADQSQTFAQLAKNVFENHTQKLEENLSSVLLKLKKKERYMGKSKAFEELNMILKCNALFNALKEHHDTRSFARSLRTISFLECDMEKEDLKLLYMTYVTDFLSLGRMEEDKLAALDELKTIFRLSEKEVYSLRSDIISYVYDELYARPIPADRLYGAQSEKAFLEILSQELYDAP